MFEVTRIILSETEWEFSEEEQNDEDIVYGSSGSSIMQFTGLTTREGKEIYEGDIVTCRDGKGVITYIDNFGKFVIDFNPFGKNTLPDFEDVYRWEDADTCMRSIEVIGNIYENKELLSQKGEKRNETRRKRI